MKIINSLRSISVWPRLVDGQNGSGFFRALTASLPHSTVQSKHASV